MSFEGNKWKYFWYTIIFLTRDWTKGNIDLMTGVGVIFLFSSTSCQRIVRNCLLKTLRIIHFLPEIYIEALTTFCSCWFESKSLLLTAKFLFLLPFSFFLLLFFHFFFFFFFFFFFYCPSLSHGHIHMKERSQEVPLCSS